LSRDKRAVRVADVFGIRYVQALRLVRDGRVAVRTDMTDVEVRAAVAAAGVDVPTSDPARQQ
jgi:hypothetical protein